MAPPNPIEGRLAQLYDQWETFAADPQATVLRWLIRDDERRMLEAFLATEDHQDGELDVLFFVFNTAFDPGRYGHDLRIELDRQLRGTDQAFAELGLPPWVSPASDLTISDIGLLMHTCAALTRHVGELVKTVTLLLWPSAAPEPTLFAQWLGRAARVVPARVRLIVIDRAEAPRLVELEGERVRSVVADLDMAGALEQLAAAAPGRGSPGGQFRGAFVAMSAALSRGQLDDARTHADRALARARESGFGHLEAAVPFALGGGLQAAGDIEGSIEQFRCAEQVAAAAPPGSEWAPGMRVKAQLGLAGAMFGANAWALAGQEYAKAGAWAGEMGDRAGQADALRMAAWAYERGGLFEDAWVIGLVGLEVAEGLDAEALERSTVPWLGELLLRLSAEGAVFERERLPVARRLGRLLGSGWRRS